MGRRRLHAAPGLFVPMQAFDAEYLPARPARPSPMVSVPWRFGAGAATLAKMNITASVNPLPCALLTGPHTGPIMRVRGRAHPAMGDIETLTLCNSEMERTAGGEPGAALALLLADSRSEETRRAYRNDLRHFFGCLPGTDPTPAQVEELCRLSSGPLALRLNGYRASMRAAQQSGPAAGRGLAQATINRRLAAVRALLRMARRMGAPCPDPAGLVSSEKTTPYRDTRGPAVSDVRLLLRAPDRATRTGRRDYAMLRILCENALRRSEVVRCTVADFDAAGKRLHILGKGKGGQRAPITLSDGCVDAVAAYLMLRVDVSPAAPLFVSEVRGTHGQALTSGGLAWIVDGYGRRALGHPLHPHALRHMAITAYLDKTAGDVRGAQKLSRHVDIRTLQIYDDNREDLQGRATKILSDLFEEEGA
jgi:integrase/recombinase XerC